MAENEKELKVEETQKKQPKTAKKKDKKPNFFVRMGKRIARFWRDYTSELKKVVWMSGKELRKSTLLVVVSVVVISAVIGLIDYGLTEAIQGAARLFW